MIDEQRVFEGPSGVLFLVHRGAAFIDDLIELAHQEGLAAFVLSSAPGQNARARERVLTDKSSWLRMTQQESLSESDVHEALQELTQRGVRVLACLSVWEGYRCMMADVNAELLAPDEPRDRLELVLDKYRMRRALCAAGLSRVQSEVVTAEWVERMRGTAQRKFIKPRRGLASFGAFEYRPEFSFEDLIELRAEMAADPDFKDVFSASPDFVAEDYIEGTEYSFEVVACASSFYVLGVHEKVDLAEQHGATLEKAVVSPPVSVAGPDLLLAQRWLEQSLLCLGLGTGCYHVEARFDGQRWEIVEINPRVGGSLINHSVRLTTDGSCLLQSWLWTLLARSSESQSQLSRRLSDVALGSERERARLHGSFFRVYYGDPGRRILKTQTHEIGREPEFMKVLVPDGTLLPGSSREVFVAQAIWRLSRRCLRDDLGWLSRVSNSAVEISYEASC